VAEPADPRDVHAIRVDMADALERLQGLTVRQQRVLFLRSAGLRYDEIANVTGATLRQVDRLLARARARLYKQAAQREMETRPPTERAARLASFERDPPGWIVSRIGKPPGGFRGGAVALLAWRRAALAIDDYRRAHDLRLARPDHEPSPATPEAARAWDLTAAAIQRVEETRVPSRDRGREP
jgi:DNA-binding CsgD family transcriptional regulator